MCNLVVQIMWYTTRFMLIYQKYTHKSTLFLIWLKVTYSILTANIAMCRSIILNQYFKNLMEWDHTCTRGKPPPRLACQPHPNSTCGLTPLSRLQLRPHTPPLTTLTITLFMLHWLHLKHHSVINNIVNLKKRSLGVRNNSTEFFKPVF